MMDICTVPVLGHIAYWGLGIVGLVVGPILGWYAHAVRQWHRRTIVGLRMAKPVFKMASYLAVGVLTLGLLAYVYIAY